MKQTEEEWRRKLIPEQYRILREKGTEPAFTGKYFDSKARGMYRCAGCGADLFSSETKYDSGSGWPSFYAPVLDDAIGIEPDKSQGMNRTEVLCHTCGGHLGHVFPDGPKEKGGRRFCINSGALEFNAKE